MSYLDRILIYPIKSLDPLEVTCARILPGGALAHDREFALMDDQGKVVNAKRTAKIHGVRSTYDLAARTVTLWTEAQSPQTFHFEADRAKLKVWFSDYFGQAITLQQNLHTGFPDDLNAAGPTLVSTATLQQITGWFPDLTLEEIRRRFRTNLEIANVPPFWEDKLFADIDQPPVPFQIGTVQFWGSNPCQRCIVPTRNPMTGDPYPGFQKQFVAQRQSNLPDWAVSARFNHFYKLTLNTKVLPSEGGKTLQVGDKLTKV
ncbi:MAG TPA: MOSC N-terminal beta barrel domain-containing protein [Allocoleopsis sp.]